MKRKAELSKPRHAHHGQQSPGSEVGKMGQTLHIPHENQRQSTPQPRLSAS